MISMCSANARSSATGLFFYRYDSVKTNAAWLDGVYVPVIKELLRYAPAFSRSNRCGNRSYVKITGDMQVIGTVYMQRPDEYLLLLVHHGPGSVKPRLTFDPAFGVKRLKGLSSAAAVSVKKGAFDIDLVDYEAKLFEIEKT